MLFACVYVAHACARMEKNTFQGQWFPKGSHRCSKYDSYPHIVEGFGGLKQKRIKDQLHPVLPVCAELLLSAPHILQRG